METIKSFFYELIKDKKVFYSVLMVSAIVLGLSSCGSGTANPPATSQTAETTAPQSSDNTETAPAAKADPATDMGVGPIKEKLSLAPINLKLAAKGEKIFKDNCSACHKIDKRYVGPALGGVTKRARPEWVMNMILNPTQMTQQDPVAKDLLAQFLTQMANMNLDKDQARAVLEYFRQNDATAKGDSTKKH